MLQEVAQEVKNTITELLQGVHTAIPGKIVNYDPAKCEAEILPYGKFKKPSGEYLDFPQLNHVPILFPQSCGQVFTMVYPINPGDECLILAQEQTLDIWRGAGAQSDNDLRFDLTNAVAIMGMFSNPSPFAKEAQDDNKLIIQKDDHRLHIKPDEMLVQFSDANNIRLNAAGITITTPWLNVIANKITEMRAGSAAETAGADITPTAPAINLSP
jgi:hypothetical protein